MTKSMASFYAKYSRLFLDFFAQKWLSLMFRMLGGQKTTKSSDLVIFPDFLA